MPYFFIIGCGTKDKEKIYASYAIGRVNFSNSAISQYNIPIIIEYSSNNFVTTQGSTTLNNPLGFLSLPYRLNFDSRAGELIQMRAYMDSNGNGVWDNNESSGRFDNTADGNSTLTTMSRVVGTICPPGYSETQSSDKNSTTTCQTSLFGSIFDSSTHSEVHYINGVDIYIDSTAGQ